MRHLTSLSRFSPGNCEPELLEAVFVARHELAARLENSVVDSVESGAGHHHLLVGPRGAGKTHLLALVHNRVVANQAIAPRLAIAYMKEEERGVASFLDFLVRVLRAFNRRGADAGQLDDALRELTTLSLAQAQRRAEQLLVEQVGERRLLLIVENLGAIFDQKSGMGHEGQQRLRDLIQQHPFWIVLASTQALFADIQRGKGPFYGFFATHHLAMFEFEESVELLRKLAARDQRPRLRAFLATAEGRGRVRAVHDITGGNPRLLVTFYQFIDSDAVTDLSESFLEMVDSLTAYYQEQMRPLTAQQQKIVEFLCEHRVPARVKDIAQACFITEQTTSKQLKLLGDMRLVVATRDGRSSYYELREPMFRICFEIKQNLGYSVALFLDFLGRFYSCEELTHKYVGAASIADAALAAFQRGDFGAGLDMVRDTLQDRGSPPLASEGLVRFVGTAAAELLRHAPVEAISGLLLTLENVYLAHELAAEFASGVTRAWMELIENHERIGLERLRQIADRVAPIFLERELERDEFTTLDQLFRTAVRYLESSNIRVLLELPLEQRTYLESLLSSDRS